MKNKIFPRGPARGAPRGGGAPQENRCSVDDYGLASMLYHIAEEVLRILVGVIVFAYALPGWSALGAGAALLCGAAYASSPPMIRSRHALSTFPAASAHAWIGAPCAASWAPCRTISRHACGACSCSQSWMSLRFAAATS